MKNHKDIYEHYLSSKQLKLTSQRMAILEAVFDLHEHFTAESLYDFLKTSSTNNNDFDVSMTTIYRTIPMLVDCGLVKIAGNINGKETFEHTFGHPQHIHILCKTCGFVIEEEDTKKIYRNIKKITDKHDFKIDDFNLSVKGKCNECSKKK
ncbi:MAG: transcriptional repressor [Candidatus Cloacimonetes bacterium]|nr:transcriptional repressor [Candidatus Cloacimonadota bacterium]